MVKNDIDQLQSFGAKIKQQNKSISASKHQNSMQQKIPLSKRLINFFKNLSIRCVHKSLHFFRKVKIKIVAFLSPYMIKIQTIHFSNKTTSDKKVLCRNQLIEKRKRIGNTIIVIRKRKKVADLKNPIFPNEFQHVYYFHKRTQQKDLFQPKKSIWDVPSKYDRE